MFNLLILLVFLFLSSVGEAADVKISNLPTLTTIVGDEFIPVVATPSGTPASKKIIINTLFSSPRPIGSVTPGTGAFTTLSASGQITSTITTGTAPFIVASTTNIPNLNASSLNGATFAAPGAIGGTTPGTGAFTTVNGTVITASTRFVPIAGTIGVPGYSFAGETNTGFSNENAGTIDVSIASAQIMRIFGTGIRIGNKALAMSSTGSYSGSDTGLSVVSAGVVGVGTGAQGSVAGALSLAKITVGAAANTVPLTISGYSVTDSGTSSLATWAGTLNTSGVVDIFKISITDTAHGAGTKLLNLYGGAGGVTSQFSIDIDGTLTTGGTAALAAATCTTVTSITVKNGLITALSGAGC